MDDEVELYKGINSKYVIYIVLGVLALGLLLFVIDAMGQWPTGFATYSPEILDNYLENTDELTALFNRASKDVPTTLKFIFGDERVNATIARMDGSRANIAIETENGNLKQVKRGEMSDPTMQLGIKETTIKKIYESENPVDDLEEALDNEDIKYDTERFTSTVKMGILNAAINIMSWFT